MRDVLIFETSTDKASLALAVEGKVVIEKSFTSDRRHNAMIFEPMAEIIEEYGRSSFDAILVGTGPGSYSGTRVGIAAAQGAALVAGCKAVGVPSILGTEDALSGEPCLAIGDARRGSYWLDKINECQVVEGPALTDRIGFEQALRTARENGTRYFSMESIRGEEIPQVWPTAVGLWQAWQNATPQDRAIWAGKIPQPIYLAPPHITPSKKEVFGQS